MANFEKIDTSTSVGKISEEKRNLIKFIFPTIIILLIILISLSTIKLNRDHSNYMQSYIGKQVLINGNPLKINNWVGNNFILSNNQHTVYADVNFVENNLILDTIIIER